MQAEVVGARMQSAITKILKAHGYFEFFEKARDFHLSVLNDPYMKLVIERIGNVVAVGHTFMQNGDVMYDPEIVFELPTWEAIEITQHPVNVYRKKYTTLNGQKFIDPGFDNSVLPLVDVWARNLRVQGYHSEDCIVSSLTHPKGLAA